MGVDAADVDNTGRTSVVVTNFSGEMLGLVPAGRRRPVRRRRRRDPTSAAPRGSTLGFGCFFFDVDLDGLQDLLVVNGHIDETISKVQARVSYAEPPHLFHNIGQAQFADIAARWAATFAQPKVGRGAAFGDFDGDGDPDVVITTNGGPAFLYRNDVLNGNRVIRVHAARRASRTATRSAQRCASSPATSSVLEDREDRIELPVAVGAAADVRPGHADVGRPRRDRVAERRARGSEVARRRA